jgi:hypothetical protein
MLPNSQTHDIFIEDMVTMEYHSQNQLKELTLILSISAGVVPVCQNPTGMFLRADCHVSQCDAASDSE